MKGNQNYFDENNEKERESIQSSQNAVKKNNIKISLEPTENTHYFREEITYTPSKEFDNHKQKSKNNTNSKNSKDANQFEENQIKIEGNEDKFNQQNKFDMNFDMEENDFGDYEEKNIKLEKNFGNEKKNRNAKSKKSSSNKFSNGILEEVGGSKFIIRTNFLEEDCFLENKDNEDERKYSYSKDQSADEHNINLINRNINYKENSDQPKKKKAVIYI